MKKNDKRGIYQGISLPKKLIVEIKKHLEEHTEYKSVTEFIRNSIRDKIKSEKYAERLFDEKTKTPEGIINWLRQDPELSRDIFKAGEKEFNNMFPEVNFNDVFFKEGNIKEKKILSVDERLILLENNDLQIIGMLDMLLEKKKKK